MTMFTQEEYRQARHEWKKAWDDFHRRQAVTCARCGLTRSNVRHETDPANSPEGRDYYDGMEMCDFLSSRPDVVTEPREASPPRSPRMFLVAPSGTSSGTRQESNASRDDSRTA